MRMCYHTDIHLLELFLFKSLHFSKSQSKGAPLNGVKIYISIVLLCPFSMLGWMHSCMHAFVCPTTFCKYIPSESPT
jgi:hypothetical protein